jgi:Protein of unknown function (DUF2721)
MEINLGTPALLFPAISLLMLAYTNRFLALAALIRQLLETYQTQPRLEVREQIAALRFRVRLILWMQGLGVGSLTLCVAAMIVLLIGLEDAGVWLFASSLALLLVSLGFSIFEIRLSANALDVALKDLERR